MANFQKVLPSTPFSFKGNKVNSRVCYRIHINSINMSDKGLLTSGGIGFSIKHKPIKVEITYNGFPNNIIEGYCKERTQSLLNNLNRKFNIPETGWEIRVEQSLNEHIGLGSTTQIEAQLVKSIVQVSLNQLPDYDDFIDNGIGIESGIGLKCFLRNGFHVDFGYWKNNSNITLLNSSNAVRESLYFYLPKEWRVLLLIPKVYSSVNGSIEQDFWGSILPIKEIEAHHISFYTLMGLIPAILDNNFNRFIESLNLVTSFGTKQYEVELNQKYNKKLFEEVKNVFGFCGLSSLGPTGYTFFENRINYSKEIESLKNNYSDFTIVNTEIAYD